MMEAIGQSTLLLSAMALALLAAAHLVFRWWVRRRVRQEAEAAASAHRAEHWLPRALREVSPPVLLLMWIHGLYLVLNILLDRMSAWSFAAPAETVLRWGYGLAVLAAVYYLLGRVGQQIEMFLNALSARLDTAWDKVMLPLAGKTVRRTLPLLALLVAAPALPVSPGTEQMFRNATSLLLIAVVAFLLYQAVGAAAELVIRRHRIDVSDNLQARAIHTQVMVLKKVAVAVIAIFALASMLMVFESARQFGASILASAGIAGIIVGFAAQRSIATLLAGFQIALTQPIRVDDVVIVENEWGRIEEITLTYVVVRIWDLRRLVLPITYFIERPFQNWTRSSAEILGTVFLHVDYTVPLHEVRAELTRILKASPLWDGKVNGLQVTDSKEHTLEIRALASAADASAAWDLRCEVREKLVDFLQRNYPDSLPRVRASLYAPVPATNGKAGERKAAELAAAGQEAKT